MKCSRRDHRIGRRPGPAARIIQFGAGKGDAPVNTSNDQLLAYYKATPDLQDIIVTIVNLDPNYVQAGIVELPLEELGIETGQTYQMHDLLTDTPFLWSGRQNFVQLDPTSLPAHVFRLRKHIRSEHDFDYYM